MGAGIVGSSIAYHHPTEAGCRDVLIIERKTRQGLGSTGKSRGRGCPVRDRSDLPAINSKTIEPLICSVSEPINDTKPPGWRTFARDYHKWFSAGVIFEPSSCGTPIGGGRAPRLLPQVRSVIDEVVAELFLTQNAF